MALKLVVDNTKSEPKCNKARLDEWGMPLKDEGQFKDGGLVAALKSKRLIESYSKEEAVELGVFDWVCRVVFWAVAFFVGGMYLVIKFVMGK